MPIDFHLPRSLLVVWYSNTQSRKTSWRTFPSWVWSSSNTQSPPRDGAANTNRSKWDWQEEDCTCCRLSLGKMPNTRQKYLIATGYQPQPVLQWQKIPIRQLAINIWQPLKSWLLVGGFVFFFKEQKLKRMSKCILQITAFKLVIHRNWDLWSLPNKVLNLKLATACTL